MRHLILLGLVLLVGACAGNSVETMSVAKGDAPNWPAPVGSVTLETAAAGLGDAQLLDIGLVVFDPGIPADRATHSKQGIFPEIRKSEARYMPYLLRQTLVDSGAWGVVRVLPKPDKAMELLVSGSIIKSDGEVLVLSVRATDATGRVWLEQIYHDIATAADYPVQPGSEPYADLYRKIANDLMRVRTGLAADELARIRQVALLQYAESLSPDAFAGFVGTAEDGYLQALRLPAVDDPMVDRVERIKNQEYLFIDNTDEQYLQLYESMAPTYDLWRQSGRELTMYKQEYESRVANRDKDGQRGSFAAMQQTYNVYARTKEHDQDLVEMAQGFNNEVTPTVMEIEGKVFRLNGSLEAQYSEWRTILRSIFSLETGLPSSAP